MSLFVPLLEFNQGEKRALYCLISIAKQRFLYPAISEGTLKIVFQLKLLSARASPQLREPDNLRTFVSSPLLELKRTNVVEGETIQGFDPGEREKKRSGLCSLSESSGSSPSCSVVLFWRQTIRRCSPSRAPAAPLRALRRLSCHQTPVRQKSNTSGLVQLSLQNW